MNEADKLIGVLKARHGYEVVEQSVSEGQIRLFGRVLNESSRNWAPACHHLLTNERTHEWNLDLSRRYILRQDMMVWGWRLIFQHPAIVTQIPSIITVLNSAPRAKFEVEEQALSVIGPRRTMSENGKGAAPSGSVPLIVRQRAGR